MNLTDEDLQEFKKIHRAEYGEDISDAKALELATSFYTLFKITLPKPDEEIEKNI